jgi:predicted ArsR family transcriptional regulator
MANRSFINHAYSERCNSDNFATLTPDCGHPGCGLLCDEGMVEWRQVNEASADYHGRRPGDAGDKGRASIQALLDEGRTLTEVAAHLGVHPALVTFAVVRSDHLAVLEAEALLRAGTMLRADVAKQTGLSHAAVERLRVAIGVPALEFVPTDNAETERMVELRGQGWSVRQIATELGVSKDRVARRLRRLACSEPLSTMSA